MKIRFNLLLMIIAISALAISITSCNKKDTVEKEQQKKIDEIIPPQFVEILKKLDMPFYEGIDPPIIEGTYFVSPNILKASNRKDDKIGRKYADKYVQFYNQNNKTFEIKIKTKQANETGASIETSITSGKGKNFTIYGQHKNTKIYNDSIYSILGIIYSGTLNDNGDINDYYFALVMMEKNDPNNDFIEIGEARIFTDEDGVVPRVTWPDEIPYINNDYLLELCSSAKEKTK